MVDLNGLISPPSDLNVYWGLNINDRGEILAQAQDADGNFRLVLLVPEGDCDDRCEQRVADGENTLDGSLRDYRESTDRVRQASGLVAQTDCKARFQCSIRRLFLAR